MKTFKEAFEHLADRGYVVRRGPNETLMGKACWYAPDGLADASKEDLDAVEILMHEDDTYGPLVFPSGFRRHFRFDGGISPDDMLPENQPMRRKKDPSA